MLYCDKEYTVLIIGDMSAVHDFVHVHLVSTCAVVSM